MKSVEAVEMAISMAEDSKNQFPGMTYEQGVAEALAWALGEVPDEEFEFAP